ncbi:ATP-binding cassette domain-containing protein [Kitasatospora azatica]|uniref:ATP-binding cassette domain-containing protein n=1 Tax=Kitasatospora azatica TaxID=58347 RepID=UPI00068B04BE|nr:ABC transporter ATP-binding protein [Kitasatospora azatica]
MRSRPLTGPAPEPGTAAPRPRRAPRLGLTSTAAALLADGLHGSRRPLLRIAALSAVEAAPALASGWVTAAALDHGFLAHRPGTGLAWLGVLALLYLVRACAERAMFDSLAAVVEPLRDHLTRRVVHNTLRQATESGRDPGTASVSRLSSQIDSARGLIASLLRTARPLAATLLAALVGLAGLDPLLAVLVLVPLTAAVAVFVWSMRRLTVLRRDTLLASEEVARQVGAVLSAAHDITSLGAEEHAASLVEAESDRARRALLRLGRAVTLRIPVVLLGGYVPLLGLLLLGPHLVDGRSITVGALIGAAVYVAGSVVPALQMMTSTVGGYWSQLGVLLHRLGEVAPERSAPARPGPTESPLDRSAEPSPTPDLTVDRLCFAYGVGAEPVLRDLSLTVPFGDHLVITGASGIGKSTLATLLAGINEPTSGAVAFAGRRVTALPEETRTRLVVLVPQEAYVFPGTVRDNLRYLAPLADDAAILHAAECVGLQPLLTRLGGLDAQLSDPAALSSGERQLLALVRTYLSPAPVVILDEATAHLDPAAEERAERAFQDRPGTLIVIAHRASSAARARRILHLDGEAHRLTVNEPLATVAS